MKPVWIKYWGLIPMTRRGYLTALAVAVVLVALLFVALAAVGRLPPFRTLWEDVPIRTATFWEYGLYNYLYRIVAVCLLAQAFDTFAVLRRFGRAAAEQAAAEAATTTAVTPASPAALNTAGREIVEQ